MDLPYDADDLCQITVDLLERNGFAEDVYIRPLAYKSEEAVANLKLHTLDSDFALMILPFGAYIEAEGAIKCQTSSWRRPDDSMMPTGVKITGLYTTSILAKTEAVMAGFDEAILLNHDGSVSEGSGENLFMVSNGEIHTPFETANALLGITRDSVLTIAKNELGIDVIQRRINRSELYLADEVFLTGTAAHLTPVGRIDNRDIGDGDMGPLTKELQDIYFECVKGNNPDYMDWCTGVTPRRRMNLLVSTLSPEENPIPSPARRERCKTSGFPPLAGEMSEGQRGLTGRRTPTIPFDTGCAKLPRR